MNRIFNKGGYLSAVLPSYEFRPEQLAMADFILERLYDGENGIIEAGTGTGKTLAYLIPVILYGLENDKKIAVSTGTKTLQKQLIDKDIPIVKEVFNTYLNMDFSFSLCLGSSNYPCRKRFEAAFQSGKVHPADLEKLKKVGHDLSCGKVFTNFDLNLPEHLWNEIKREGDSCNSYKCPFIAVCAYQNARKQWEQAHLLVMNHHLFFSHIASGKTYLPHCEIVVFDEAHSVEDIAATQIGFNLGYRELMDIINRFYSDKKRNLLNSIIKDDELRSRCIRSIKRTVKEINKFYEAIRAILPPEKNTIRLKEPIAPGTVNPLIELLKEFMMLLAESDHDIEDDNPWRIEFDIARGKLFIYLEQLTCFIFQIHDNYVYWLEREPDKLFGDLHLRGQPVDASDMLNREIVASHDSSIFVSATLAVDGDFSFIVDRLGIENHKTLYLQSSFDYKLQAVLYIAKNIADPGSDTYSVQASSDAAEIINHLKGNCLILFTSYKSLREVRNIISGLIDYTVYSQDTSAATDAIERYVNDGNSVLMGTNSFWQGLDLRGDLVRGVIMMKLPFAVPDSPPVEAKMERFAAEGRNPFYEFQIPEAVLRFKQGFGRLIRSGTDRGIVAVLDSRILHKNYGKYFLKSIPECNIVYSIQDLKEAHP